MTSSGDARMSGVGGFEVVDEGLRELYDRAVEVLGADERVKAVEVSGSIARGVADRWSDLDLSVIAHPDHHEALLGEWPRWLAEITPTVFARTPIAPFIINAVTDRGLTLDIAVYSGEVLRFPPPRYAVGMLSARQFDDVGSALEYAVAEQLRGIAGPFVSLLQRGEHARHLTGVPHLLGLLTTVFLAETGSAPLGKRWNDTLTDEQRSAIAALPPVRATFDDLLAFGLGIAELTVTRARPLYPQHGLEWPAAFARVAAARVRSQLGVDVSGWLS